MTYSLYRNVKQRTKAKAAAMLTGFAAVAVSLALAMPGGLASAVISQAYTPYGDATIVSGGNPGHAVQTVSSTTGTGYGGVDFAVPAGMTFSQLTNLGTDYKITAADCGGGSPRFQVNIGGHNVFVYIGPTPNFTSCTTNTWLSTGNLAASPDVRVDTSQYTNGSYSSTYADAETLLGSQTVTGIQLVTDGGWKFGTQTVLFDNTQINDNTYDYEPVPSLKTCKNNGWKQFTNPTFKNQGDCVSWAQHHNGVGQDDSRANLR